MRTLQRVGAGVLALTLGTGIAACGSDDDDATTTTTEAPDAGLAAFCDAVVEFNGAVTTVELDETSTEEDIKATGEQLGPIFAVIAEDAPDSVSEPATELNAAIEALDEGDAEAFNADSTFETYTTFLTGAVQECDFPGVDVAAVDYAFEGVPETVDAGVNAFNLTNESDAEDHELVIFRKADGEALSFEELLELGEEEVGDRVQFVGAAFAPMGASGAALADLTPGDYAMVCFIPVGSGEEGPPHFTEGMIQEFTVE